MNKCIVCGKREQDIKEEEYRGRIIDGSWYHDNFLPFTTWGMWVCSWECYNKLITPYLKMLKGDYDGE